MKRNRLWQDFDYVGFRQCKAGEMIPPLNQSLDQEILTQFGEFRNFFSFLHKSKAILKNEFTYDTYPAEKHQLASTATKASPFETNQSNQHNFTVDTGNSLCSHTEDYASLVLPTNIHESSYKVRLKQYSFYSQ